MKVLTPFAAAACIAMTAPVGAVTWSTTTSFGAGSGGQTGCYSLSAKTTDAAGSKEYCSGSYTTADGTLLVRAYSTSGSPTAVGSRSSMNGSWLEGQLAGYGGSGLGIKNNVTGDSSEGSDPEHAVDNEQILDVLVYQLPTLLNTTWTFASLGLGWITGKSGADATPEINVWIGGSSLGANYDFRDVCFQGCASGDKTLTGTDPATGLGFAYAGRLDFASTGTLTSASLKAGDFAGANPAATGQYIVIAASVSAGTLYDAFKVKNIGANKVDVPPPPPGVPEPGSLVLLAAGLLGFGLMRRRPA